MMPFVISHFAEEKIGSQRACQKADTHHPIPPNQPPHPLGVGEKKRRKVGNEKQI
jgi:hypothetical protein